MPLVKTIVEHDVATTFGKIKAEAIVYRRPADVKPGDTIVAPTESQLAELAAQYPEEYGVKGRKGATPAAADAGDDADAGEAAEDPTAGALARFDGLNAKDAISAIGELDDATEADLETLALWFEAEQERDEPRSTVLEAFARKGLK